MAADSPMIGISQGSEYVSAPSSASSSRFLSKYPRHPSSNSVLSDATHSFNPVTKLKVGILGATGTVGQRFITLLASHPWFSIHALGASPGSVGKLYGHAAKWKQTSPIPGGIKELLVDQCAPDGKFAECDIVFSGLDADVAYEIEGAFRSANIPVFSNAKSYRRDPNVPLIVPLVNLSHMSIIPQQKSAHSPPLSKGFVITNANCSTTACVVPLHALERSFGPIESLMVTTMQAISGAGYPGVASLDIMDNVVPYVSGEEEKMEWETLKILGGISETDEGVKEFDMHAENPLRVSASCNRVAVIDGHTECVSVRFGRRPPPSPQQVREALAAYTPEAQALGCPSAPRRAIIVHEEPDRPQPRLDRWVQDGAGVSVGRVRQCQVLDIKFVVLANNVSIGAATSSIMNAEYAVLKGLIGE